MSDEKWYAIDNGSYGYCEHCRAYMHHEKWCITSNSAVQYAFTVVTKSQQFMSQGDHILLNGLGVKWVDDEVMCLPSI